MLAAIDRVQLVYGILVHYVAAGGGRLLTFKQYELSASYLPVQIVFFQRDSTTGVLSSPTTISVVTEAATVTGEIAAFSLSTSTNQLFVSMTDSTETGGVVILDFEVRLPSNLLQRIHGARPPRSL